MGAQSTQMKPKDKDREPGTVREGRIPIYDHKGQMRGHVGPHATSVTVSRFVNQLGAKLGTKDGRPAWIGPKPPPPKKPKADPAAQAAKAAAAQGPQGSGSTPTLKISIEGAKGSANPTKGQASAQHGKGKK
jgi:hypothetical protein